MKITAVATVVGDIISGAWFELRHTFGRRGNMAQQSHSVNVAQPTLPLIRTARCVTVPAVNANTCHRNFRANLRGKKFRHAGYHVGALPRFFEASCFFDQHPSGCHFGRHFCEMTLDCLVVENSNSKRLSFFREATGTPKPPSSSGMFRLKKQFLHLSDNCVWISTKSG
jgi:hypothetical protein